MGSIRFKSLYIVLGLAFIFVITVFALFLKVNTVEATHLGTGEFDEPTALHGYAWSDTIGWISLNCAEGGPTGNDICGTSNYKVEIIPDSDPTDATLGKVVGYAWSDNIGWIQFGGLSNFPDPTYGDAEVRKASTDNNYYFYGWARACAGTLNGDCSTMANHPDGWDGWISLKCKNTGCGSGDPKYLIKFNNTSNTFSTSGDSPFAWGSDVVGWISFDAATFNAPCTVSTQCNNPLNTGTVSTNAWCVQTETPCLAPLTCTVLTPTTAMCGSVTIISGTLEASALIVRKGSPVTLDWDMQATTGTISGCHVDGSNGDNITGASGASTDTGVSSPLTLAETIFTVYCSPTDGSPDVAGTSIIVKTLPYVSET